MMRASTIPMLVIAALGLVACGGGGGGGGGQESCDFRLVPTPSEGWWVPDVTLPKTGTLALDATFRVKSDLSRTVVFASTADETVQLWSSPSVTSLASMAAFTESPTGQTLSPGGSARFVFTLDLSVIPAADTTIAFRPQENGNSGLNALDVELVSSCGQL